MCVGAPAAAPACIWLTPAGIWLALAGIWLAPSAEAGGATRQAALDVAMPAVPLPCAVVFAEPALPTAGASEIASRAAGGELSAYGRWDRACR